MPAATAADPAPTDTSGGPILVIVWHLLTDPTARFRDLGPDFHTRRVNTDRKIRSLVHQLEALGHTVTLQPAA